MKSESKSNRKLAWLLAAFGAVSLTSLAHAMTQNLILNNLSTRRAQLHTEIATNLNAGKIHPGQAADLRASLDRLADLQSTFSEDSALDNRETQILVDGYTQVTTNMNQYIAQSPGTYGSLGPAGGPVNTPGFWYPNRQRSWDRRSASSLLRRIDNGLASGRLTMAEAAHLRRKYNNLAQEERRLSYNRAYGGYNNSNWNDLNNIVNRLLNTRQANVRIRHWD
jgi:hypothetical protein